MDEKQIIANELAAIVRDKVITLAAVEKQLLDTRQELQKSQQENKEIKSQLSKLQEQLKGNAEGGVTNGN